MMSCDLVSIIIPTYKGSENIKRAVQSALNQTYPQIEVFVIDDNGLGSDEQKKTEAAKGHVAALKYSENHTGTEVFNLGTGEGYTVLEVIDAFERATGITIPYQFAPRRPGDIAESYANTEKAYRILGWKAEKSIEDMCRDAWRWQQKSSF